MLFTFWWIYCSMVIKSSRSRNEENLIRRLFVFLSLFWSFPALKDLTALAKELRELRTNEETNRPPRKVTDYSSSSEESESSEDEDGEGGAHDGTVPVSDIPRIMWVFWLTVTTLVTFLWVHGHAFVLSNVDKLFVSRYTLIYSLLLRASLKKFLCN